MKEQDRRSYNSSLRPTSLKKQGRKPEPRKKPTLDEVKKKYGIIKASDLEED